MTAIEQSFVQDPKISLPLKKQYCEEEDTQDSLKKVDHSPGKKNKELGRRGEQAAARFLYRRGYDIVAQNWVCPYGEADIVARDADTLVFVEVKTRSNCEKGFPAEAVNQKKRDKYERIALAFLKEYGESDIIVRFDVVSIVVIAPDRALIRHHINAFSVG